jgi:hypothetical protein
MASRETYKCKSCGEDFTARTADRKRGWARFCSKSCKASAQEKRTGQYRRYVERNDRFERDPLCDLHPFDSDNFSHS